MLIIVGSTVGVAYYSLDIRTNLSYKSELRHPLIPRHLDKRGLTVHSVLVVLIKWAIYWKASVSSCIVLLYNMFADIFLAPLVRFAGPFRSVCYFSWVAESPFLNSFLTVIQEIVM